MTNARAIEVLYKILNNSYVIWHDEAKDALLLAISVLKKEKDNGKTDL